jgi:hypothetical protein
LYVSHRPLGHEIPHTPQWLGLVRDTTLPPQQYIPEPADVPSAFRLAGWHVPPEHVRAVWHASGAAPQFDPFARFVIAPQLPDVHVPSFWHGFDVGRHTVPFGARFT